MLGGLIIHGKVGTICGEAAHGQLAGHRGEGDVPPPTKGGSFGYLSFVIIDFPLFFVH